MFIWRRRLFIGLLGRDPAQSHLNEHDRDWVQVPMKVVGACACKSGTRRGDCTAMGVTSAPNSMMTSADAAGDVRHRSIYVHMSSGIFCLLDVVSSVHAVLCLLSSGCSD